MRFILFILVALALLLACLQVWRWSDRAHAERVWQELASKYSAAGRFDPAMVAGLPEPARRYFLFTIAAGAPISTVAEIRMSGELGLGTKDDPNYQSMHAEQILAPPFGLVWKVSSGNGWLTISGSDGASGTDSWTRFWLAGAIPVVRAGGSADHARAAFGRVVAEAAFWAPASLLPQFGTTWETAGDNTARASVSNNGMTQVVDITVDDQGRPVKVVIPRWTDANADREFRVQPFGGYLSEYREFDGYTLPTRVDGGNWIDTEGYFPFYRASVEDIRFRTRRQ